MTDLGDWRWAFLVHLPVVAAAAVAAHVVLPETPRHAGRGLPDPVGAGMLAGAAATVSLALSECASWGVVSLRFLAGIVVAAVLAWAFVHRSSRVREPLLDLTLLRNRQVLSAAMVTGCYSAGLYGFLVTLPLFAIGHWHLSLAGAGATALAPGLVVVALSVEVGRFAERVGHRVVLVTGACVMALSLMACATTLGGDQFQHRWLLVGPVLGIGIGLCYPVLAGAAVHGLASTDLAAASAVNQCARQLGAVVGTAATIGVLGNDLAPGLARIHAAWVLGALFCTAAAVAAVLIPSTRGARRTAAPTTGPTDHVAEEAGRR
jgi:predicted MFS family arabinose efflux permease